MEAPRPERIVVRCDVSGVTADAAALDALARLQLTAHRFGATLLLHDAGRALTDLIEWAGLAEVLLVESGVEPEGQVEEREELGIDEEVHRGDGAV